MTSNLLLYEIVLLILGAILFILLCCALVYSILKKEPIKRFLLFFPIAIAMIAYPSIQELRYENGKISLTTQQEELISNPEDEETRKNLQETADKLENRASTAEDYLELSNSYLLLEESEKAIKLALEGKEKKAKELGYSLVNGSLPVPVQLLAYDEIIDLAEAQLALKSQLTQEPQEGDETAEEILIGVQKINPDMAGYLKNRYEKVNLSK